MRIALITGGAGGIGQATARRLLADGLQVVVADIDGAAVSRATEAIGNSDCQGMTLDVSSEADVERVFTEIEDRIGPVSVLVHLAGIIGISDGQSPHLADSCLQDWEHVFNVNARGTYLTVREMARRRSAKPVPHGRIITMASLAAQMGGLQSGPAYAASKGAVIALTRNAARNLAELEITANAIAPGPIDTPMLATASQAAGTEAKYSRLDSVPLKRVGKPDEIAAAVSFLASIEAAYVTGAVIDVNGGMAMN
ncbi:MAG: SDR family NAD(P)-dependent oxidoreductase [Sphingobium sp.]